MVATFNVVNAAEFDPGMIVLGGPSLREMRHQPKDDQHVFSRLRVALPGLEVTVIGHSEIVGKPIAFLLMAEGATVTVCHHMTREVAVHTVDTFHDNQDAAIITSHFCENVVQFLPIVMSKWTSSCTTKHRSLNNAVMRQGIVKDQITCTNNVADCRLVG